MKAFPDHHTEHEARQLAERITAYWAERGYAVTANIVPWRGKVNAQERSEFWCVRTDMVNGHPVKKLAVAA